MIGRLRKLLSTTSLGTRLGATLILALLPLGVLSIVQTQAAQRDVDASTLEGIAGTSLQAVQEQIDLIKDAQITARVLASALSHALPERADCNGRVASVSRGIPEATIVAYIPNSGLMTCSSTGRSFDFSSVPGFPDLVSKGGPSIVFSPHGVVSGTAIITVTHPVVIASGEQLGLVAISLPYGSVAPRDYANPVSLWRPVYLATFTREGELLISSDPKLDLASTLPKGIGVADLPALAGRPSFQDGSKGRHILSVTTVANDLFLLSLWQSNSDGLFSSASPIAPYLLPVLTWLATLVAAAFASNRLVVRHVRALSRSMTDFVIGRTRVGVPDVTEAPAEIQRLHAAYLEMIRTIEQEEAELQNLIIDKDSLLREINHRSGNSLQIIASVMRMYRRETRDPSLQTVLDGLINRVIALSSTHTSLYVLSGQKDVPLDEVLYTVIRRLKEIHRVALGTTEKRFDPIRMDAEAAIPLALAVAEASTCYFAVPNLMPGQIVVSLTEVDGKIRLGIEGPAVPQLLPGNTHGIAGLPQRMLHRFATQLAGTLDIREVDGRSHVELIFPRKAP